MLLALRGRMHDGANPSNSSRSGSRSWVLAWLEIGSLTVPLGLVLAIGCQKDPAGTQAPASERYDVDERELEEREDQDLEQAEQDLERAGEELEDAAERSGEAIEESIDEAEEEIDEAVDAEERRREENEADPD